MKTKGLTIQEAIQSGLPFKREIWHDHIFHKASGNKFEYNAEDILATDWQIKVPEVTITREKLEEAVNKCFYYYVSPKGLEEHKLFINKLAKELGL